MKLLRNSSILILLLILFIAGCNPANQQQNIQGQGLDQNQTQGFQRETYPYQNANPFTVRENPNLTGFTRQNEQGYMTQYDHGYINRSQQGQGFVNQNQTRGTEGYDLHHVPPQQNMRGFNQGTKAPQTPNRNRDAQEVAERLVKLATRVEQVNDATAVVVGRWAVVGIDLDATLDRARVGTIKYTVAEALKSDPKGAYAIVTADIDTNYRLRQMAEDIRQGRPIEGVMDELAEIVGRIMPQIPRQIEEAEEPPQERTENRLTPQQEPPR